MNEILPTQVRIISIGFIKTFGSITMMVTPYLLKLCVSNGFSIMLLFTFLAASSFVFIQVLGVSKTGYGVLMFSMSLSYIIGTFVCRRLLPRFGVQRTVAIAGACTLVARLAAGQTERHRPPVEHLDDHFRLSRG